MYATKPLSLFKNQPEAAFAPPPDGRNSGYLVVKGAADDEEETRCCGLLPDRRVRELPFPQDRVLTVRYTVNHGQNSSTHREYVVFVPVADQPLASNRYYAVVAKGKRRGLVMACSREADRDMATCCFCRRVVRDVPPRPFNPADIYQQVEIVRRRRGWFTATAVAADGIPSEILRHRDWEVYASKTRRFYLGEALGLDAAALRSRQLIAVPGAFPAAGARAAAAVGKWYSPFFLVVEPGVAPLQQMERSVFYEVALEQRWEPVHAHAGGVSTTTLASKRAFIGGSVEAKQAASNSPQGDAYVWFMAAATGQWVGVGTSMWERMRWEQYMGGWVDDEEEDADAGRIAGGSVLVERFVVKRLDGSVVVAFDFVHLNKVIGEQL